MDSQHTEYCNSISRPALTVLIHSDLESAEDFSFGFVKIEGALTPLPAEPTQGVTSSSVFAQPATAIICIEMGELFLQLYDLIL